MSNSHIQDAFNVIRDTHARELQEHELLPIIAELNTLGISDDTFIQNGVLDLIWNVVMSTSIITYMDRLCDGRLWAHISRLSTSSFPDWIRRAILYNHPISRNVHDALDMLAVPNTYAYGMLLLRNITDTSFANLPVYDRSNIKPLQYAVALPHVTMEIIQLLIRGGANISELITLDTIVDPEIRTRIEEELLRMTAESQAWYSRISMPLFFHLVEHRLPYILEGGTVRPFAQDEPIRIPPWPARRLWLNDYLFQKSNTRQLPHLPRSIVIQTPLMQSMWSMARRQIISYPASWNTFLRPFLDICLRHTVTPLQITLPLYQYNPSPSLRPLYRYILERAGYASAAEIRAVKKCIRRPERLNWLEPYYDT